MLMHKRLKKHNMRDLYRPTAPCYSHLLVMENIKTKTPLGQKSINLSALFVNHRSDVTVIPDSHKLHQTFFFWGGGAFKASLFLTLSFKATVALQWRPTRRLKRKRRGHVGDDGDIISQTGRVSVFVSCDICKHACVDL